MTTKLKIPKIRFKEFSGEWEEKTFKDFSIINQGLQIAISERFTEKVENSYFYITNEFLREGNKKMYYIKNPPKSVLCYKDDLLMTRTGNTGKLVTGVEGAFHNNFFKIKYDKNIVDKMFIYLFLNSQKTQNKILSLAGTSTIPDLNHGDFYKLKIHIPQLQEQQKISQFLSSVDEKIEKIKEKKKNRQDYKKGLMQKIFSQEIIFKDKNGEDFGKWEEKSLGEICKINKGTQLNAEHLTQSGLYPAMNGGINPSGFNSEFNKYENTITISEGGNSCGYVNFVKTKFWCGGHCYALENIKCNNLFLYQILKFNENNIMRLRVGSGLPNIQKKDIDKFNISFPTLKEQEKIADFLSGIDEKIEKVSNELAKMEEFKKGLLQGMFV